MVDTAPLLDGVLVCRPSVTAFVVEPAGATAAYAVIATAEVGRRPTPVVTRGDAPVSGAELGLEALHDLEPLIGQAAGGLSETTNPDAEGA